MDTKFDISSAKDALSENYYDWIITDYIDEYCDSLYEEGKDSVADNIYDKVNGDEDKLTESYFKFAKKTVKGLIKYLKKEDNQDGLQYVYDMLSTVKNYHFDIPYAQWDEPIPESK